MFTNERCSKMASKWVIVHMLSTYHEEPMICFIRAEDISYFSDWSLSENQEAVPCCRLFFKNGTAMNIVEDVSELAEKLVGVTIQGPFDSEPPPGVMS